MEDVTSGTTSDADDDLDITRPTKRIRTSLNGQLGPYRDASRRSAYENRDEPNNGATSRTDRAEGAKAVWSEGDSDKSSIRLKAKRLKRTAPTARQSHRAAYNGFVGKRRKVEKSDAKRTKKLRQWDEETDDDQLMEHTLPDYLQERRARFDERTRRMREMGLRLPPSYDDIDFSDNERMADLEERPLFESTKPVAAYKDKTLPKSLGIVPASVAQWLRDYQIEGTAFLHELFVYQTGGILGDDMGLGKTVQVIAFLTAAFGKTGDERDAKRMRKLRRAKSAWYPKVLVVCPGTLIENWKDELQRWGWWHVDVYHGSVNSRDAALQAAANGRLEILITTYATYRTNKSAINMVEWDCVIADECHQIKGRDSETTIAMNEVNALCRIGLTGTAIQNSYDELWTLLNWTNPGKLGPISTWKRSISDPLRQGQSHDATNYQLSKARKTARALVQNLLPQFFLRRMKSLIADQLPKKSDRVVFCPLTVTQADAYENIIDSDVVRFIRESTDACNCGSGKKLGWCCQQLLPDGTKWQHHVFPSIYHLQRLSNHLATLIPQSSDPREKQEKDLETLQAAVPDQWRELYRTRDSILNYSNPEFCGKWKVLRKLLHFWHTNGDKVLVFSHSVRLLRMLQLLFQHTTYNVSYLDGAMSYLDRSHAVSDFNSDPDQFVFLISTKAGGVGLNITSANKVVVVDPNWNPAYDLQAQDRAYRIGQVRDVEVFRLVSAGTIEEIVYARQIYKQQQANIGYTASTERRYFKGVQENKYQKGEIFGLANLFNYQHENLVLRDIVNKTNVAESKAGVAIVGVEFDDSQNFSPDASEEGKPTLPVPHPTQPQSSSDSNVGEEKAMSQLAALIVHEAEAEAGIKPSKRHVKAKGGEPVTHDSSAGGKIKSKDPIAAILATAGVEYTHENSEVIGPSKIESRLSRRAIETAHEGDLDDNRAVFQNSSSHSTSNYPLPHSALRSSSPRPPPSPLAPLTSSGLKSENAGDPLSTIPYRYHPPLSVRKRHLCSMAESFGFDDVVEFALVVEGWTQSQRRDALDRFYHKRRRRLFSDELSPEAGIANEVSREGNRAAIKQERKSEGPRDMLKGSVSPLPQPLPQHDHQHDQDVKIKNDRNENLKFKIEEDDPWEL